MNSYLLVGSTAVPLIAGIVQIAKIAGLPTRLSPLAALLLGVAAGVLSLLQDSQHLPGWPSAVVLGLTWGLAASGLYQVTTAANRSLRSKANSYAPPSQSVQQGQRLGALPPKP